MPLVNLQRVLQDAEIKGYAVGAFNVSNLNILTGVLKAAESKKSPVIISFAEGHFPFMDFELMMAAGRCAANRASVPVVLHLDHGLSFDAIVKAIRYGASSIMVDASMQPLEKNIKIANQVIELCKPLNISVEAELGCVGGGEGDGSENEVDISKFTDPNQATEYVQQAGIDALAIAFGNVHGQYKGEPKLNFNLLSDIKKRTNLPLVLHGGSGISDADFKKAISLGIRKINFYTGSSLASNKGLEDYLAMQPLQNGKDIAHVWEITEQAYFQNTMRCMEVFGSAGKA